MDYFAEDFAGDLDDFFTIILLKEYLETEMFSLLTGLRYANLPASTSFLNDGTLVGSVSSGYFDLLSITVLRLNCIGFEYGGYNFFFLKFFDRMGPRLDDARAVNTLCV